MTDTPLHLLAHATEFTFPADAPPVPGSVKVQRRYDAPSSDSWAITRLFDVWDGQAWVYEPQPSNRTDDFKRRTRFPLSEAVAIAQQLADQIGTTHGG